jgi:hypothetical protein
MMMVDVGEDEEEIGKYFIEGSLIWEFHRDLLKILIDSLSIALYLHACMLDSMKRNFYLLKELNEMKCLYDDFYDEIRQRDR